MAHPAKNGNKGVNIHPAFEHARNKKMSEFSDDELKELENKVRSSLFNMLLGNEFFGIVALRLQREFTDSVPTAATDGRKIYYNPAFVEKLNTKEITFLTCHEVYHCVFEHFLRKGNRIPEWWNMAGDYVINLLCKRDNIGTVIEGALLDNKYADMTSEEVYEKLEEEAADFLDTLDTHIEMSENGEEDKDGNGPKDKDGNPITISVEDAKAIREEIRATIIQAAKTAGNAPAEVKRIIADFLEPKIRWQDLLESTIHSTFREDVSFARPDRKSWSNSHGIVFPGATPGSEINIAIAIDNSGSISDEQLREFLSEINAIMNNYSSFTIKLWCFDTRVSGLAEYDEHNKDDLSSYVCTGGGGTYIKSNFDYFEEEDFDADLLVIFTDLYCGSLNAINPNIVETTWIINGNKSGVPPFGKYAYYD